MDPAALQTAGLIAGGIVAALIVLFVWRKERPRPAAPVGLPMAAIERLKGQGLEHHCAGRDRDVAFFYGAGADAAVIAVRIHDVYGYRGRESGYRWADAILASTRGDADPRLFLASEMHDFRDMQTGAAPVDIAAWLTTTYRLNEAAAQAPKPRRAAREKPADREVTSVPAEPEVVMFEYADANGVVTLRLLTMQRLYVARPVGGTVISVEAIGGQCHERKAWRKFRTDRMTGLRPAGASKPLKNPASWLVARATKRPFSGGE